VARDPRRSKYLSLAKEGYQVSLEMVEYMDDPQATVLCEHLVPVERAIRKAGLVVFPFTGHALQAFALCCIDEAALRKKLALPASVVYYERAYQTETDAWIECRACQSRLITEFPSQGHGWYP